MKRILLAATCAAMAVIPLAFAVAQATPGDVTIWNGTSVPLKFGYESAGHSSTLELPPNGRIVLPCVQSGNLSIATGANQDQSVLRCGSGYSLYFDDEAKKFRAAIQPLAPGDQQTGILPGNPQNRAAPLRKLLENQGAAVNNRAAVSGYSGSKF